jgi:hypothetical protein
VAARLELAPPFGVLARVLSAVQNFQFEDWRAVKAPVSQCLQPFVAGDLVSAALKGGVVDDEIPAAEGPGYARSHRPEASASAP